MRSDRQEMSLTKTLPNAKKPTMLPPPAATRLPGSEKSTASPSSPPIGTPMSPSASTRHQLLFTRHSGSAPTQHSPFKIFFSPPHLRPRSHPRPATPRRPAMNPAPCCRSCDTIQLRLRWHDPLPHPRIPNPLTLCSPPASPLFPQRPACGGSFR